MTTPATVRLDACDPELPQYPNLPMSWTAVVGPRLPLGQIYAEAHHRLGKRAWWGFIADDVVPETRNWDQILIEAAGTDGMAVPDGGHSGTPHFVIGGGLVEEMGWLCLPGLDRLYIDTVWADIARAKGVLRRVPEVVLRHHHFSNGRALFDRVYRKMHKAEDRAIYQKWKAEHDATHQQR